jgi:hypothetical protein
MDERPSGLARSCPSCSSMLNIFVTQVETDGVLRCSLGDLRASVANSALA